MGEFFFILFFFFLMTTWGIIQKKKGVSISISFLLIGNHNGLVVIGLLPCVDFCCFFFFSFLFYGITFLVKLVL